MKLLAELFAATAVTPAAPVTVETPSDWLIAAAGPAGAPPNAGLINLIMIGFIIVFFYFLIWRPQAKRRKEHTALMQGLSKGDEVVSAGGIVGQITKVEDEFVKIQLSDSVEIRMQKSAIGATLPKGTLKSLDGS
ncbi:MAG: preprotein translocase subunit YajC [Pseudomonadota bacterium]